MSSKPFEIIGEQRPSRWVITCDHASNHVPNCINGGDLGIDERDMKRHIAYDIGAAGVCRYLSEMLDGPAILSQFSRLVIDPNRGEKDPTVLMRLYDGTIINANRHADHHEKQRRIDKFHRPYHQALATLAERQNNTIILAIHSFTPMLKDQKTRPWHLGILHEHDDRLAKPLLLNLRKDTSLCVGENEPYRGHLDGDSIHRHALTHGRLNVLIEIRNDLIETDAGQQKWAQILAPILKETIQVENL